MKEKEIREFFPDADENLKTTVYFLAMTAGTLLTLLGETTQAHPDQYAALRYFYGEGIANFILGNLGDFTGPLAFGAIIGTIHSILKKTEAGKSMYLDELGDYPAVTAASFFSITYIIEELIHLTLPRATYPEYCKEQYATCYGDYLDLLLLSTPLLIWGLLYLINYIQNKEIDVEDLDQT